MSDYISREAAIAEFSELQELARKRAYDTPTNSPAYDEPATWETIGGFLSTGDVKLSPFIGILGERERVTHWMPLPKPPKTKENPPD